MSNVQWTMDKVRKVMIDEENLMWMSEEKSRNLTQSKE